MTALAAVVAVGVAVFLAVGLANRAAVASFGQFASSVAGQSQLVAYAATGPLSDDDLAAMRQALLETEASILPVIETTAALPSGASGEGPKTAASEPDAVALLGIDLLPLLNAIAREGAVEPSQVPPALEEEAFWDTLANQRAFFSSERLAAARGWRRGERVTVFMDDRALELEWAGSYPKFSVNDLQSDRLLAMERRHLAVLLGRQGEADRAEIFFPDRARRPAWTEEARRLLDQANPGHWAVETRTERQQTGETMTRAFRANLRALSALALIVALILVLQALDGAVARRKRETAILAALGVSPTAIRLFWLAEAALIGALGGGLGIALGHFIAAFSVQAVAQTVTALYYFAPASGLPPASGREMALAWLVSVAVCVVAGWLPAREAARQSPAQLIKQGAAQTRYLRRGVARAALICAAIGAVAAAAPPLAVAGGRTLPIGGYILALALIGLAASLGSLGLEGIGRLGGRLGQLGAAARIGLTQFRRPVARHRLALSGIVAAIGMTVGMVLLVGSFRHTVESWLGQILQADLYISAKSRTGNYGGSRIGPETCRSLIAHPQVVDSSLVFSARTAIDGRPATLVGYDTAYLQRRGHIMWLREPEDLGQLRLPGRAVASESLLERFGLEIGDRVALPFPGGEGVFEIIGVYRDFGSELGSLAIDKDQFQALTSIDRASGVGLHLAPAGDPRALADALQRQYPALKVLPTKSLRQEAMDTFRRVFAITYALQAIGLAVSAAGLASMLFSLLLERREQWAALRLVGAGRRHLAGAALWEGLGLAFSGGAIGTALGFALGAVLIFIVNKQSFGWTLAVRIDVPPILALLLTVLAAAAAVSWSIGQWASRRLRRAAGER